VISPSPSLFRNSSGTGCRSLASSYKRETATLPATPDVAPSAENNRAGCSSRQPQPAFRWPPKSTGLGVLPTSQASRCASSPKREWPWVFFAWPFSFRKPLGTGCRSLASSSSYGRARWAMTPRCREVLVGRTSCCARCRKREGDGCFPRLLLFFGIPSNRVLLFGTQFQPRVRFFSAPRQS
jgi:hypothetical protein